MTTENLIKLMDEMESSDGIYLLDSLSEDSGFFTSAGKLLYMVRDSYSYLSEGIDTEYLSLQTHIRINSVRNNQTFKDGDYNIIIFKGKKDDSNLEYFIKLCSVYTQSMHELDFKDFFYSLISIFQLPATQNYLNVLGLYGELKIIQLAAEKNVDLAKSWHKNGSYSRFDFSCNGTNLEVKTTVADDLSVTIKHKQLFEISECFLLIVNCDEAEDGETLKELIEAIYKNSIVTNDIEFNINLAKELKRIAYQDYTNVRLKLQWIKIFNASEINPFPVVPDNVESLTYKLDTSEFSESLQKSFTDLLQQFL